MMNYPDVLNSALCCIYGAVLQTLEEHGLHAPEKGGPTHKGEGDWQCGTSLWLWWGPTTPRLATSGQPTKCADPKTRILTVALGYELCTEDIDCPPCEQPTCTDDNGDGCPDFPEGYVPGPCEEGGISLAHENAYMLRARYVLECFDPKCCFDNDCVPTRCEGTDFLGLEHSTEGNMSFLVASYAVTW